MLSNYLTDFWVCLHLGSDSLLKNLKEWFFVWYVNQDFICICIKQRGLVETNWN